MEPEQCGRLEDRGELGDSAGVHEQRCQSEHEAIKRGEIRGTLPGAIDDLQLTFEQQ